MDFFCFRPSIGSARAASSTFPPPVAVKRSNLAKRLHLPEYISQTDTGLLVFRMKVPADCRHVLHKTVLKFSLRTHCVYTARKHVASLLPYFECVFAEMRAGEFDGDLAGIWQTLKAAAQQIIKDEGLQKVSRWDSKITSQVAAQGFPEDVHHAHYRGARCQKLVNCLFLYDKKAIFPG